MGKLKEIIKYEIETTKDSLKNTSVLLDICAVIVLIGAVARMYLLTLFAIFAVIILKMKLDFESGEVTRHYREKLNIPNKADIKEIKRHSS
jgi:hypothetical protein